MPLMGSVRKKVGVGNQKLYEVDLEGPQLRLLFLHKRHEDIELRGLHYLPVQKRLLRFQKACVMGNVCYGFIDGW